MYFASRVVILLALGLATADTASAQPDLQVAPDAEIAPAPPPSEAPEQPPEQLPYAGPYGIETTFVSSTGMGWDVYVDQQPTCATPCQLFLDRAHWITLKTQERQPIRLDIGQLGGVPTAVTAHDLQQGKYATGITFTTLGGMAAVTGITLTAVGCATERSGMCTAGLITGGVGLLTTYGGIWLMRAALPRAQVRQLARSNVQLQVGGTSVGLAGGF
ncbi:MAG: hypothetical protein R3B48_14535 [Kofleriaceae bacterium]